MMKRKSHIKPLKMAPKAEREKAYKRGQMLFYDEVGSHNNPITVPLKSKRFNGELNLQGVYKTHDGLFIGLGSTPKESRSHEIEVFELDNPDREIEGDMTPSIFFMSPDLGHMELRKRLRGQGIGVKAASKAEKHVRSQQGGKHEFRPLPMFVPLFKKLGYKVERKWGVFSNPLRPKMSKVGKHEPKDNLHEFHNIEAINPKTGKVETFAFPIKT
jgi:hypothetical protein